MHWLVVLDVLVVGVFGVSGWCFCARGVLLVCYGWWGGSVFFACILCACFYLGYVEWLHKFFVESLILAQDERWRRA